jgi:hypothetical protein
MNLEITPEPTDDERAAIAAALAGERQAAPEPAEVDDCEEIQRP